MSKRIGLVINPIAGMGGSVGLKGTDGEEVLREARERGAVPVAGERALLALAEAGDLGGEVLTAGGAMGAETLERLGVEHRIVHHTDGTVAEDTVAACRRFVEEGVDLIVFVGGDGTARDVMEAVGTSVPVIGVPAGVKMHSAVFTNTPQEGGRLIRRFLEGGLEAVEREVMDIDEAEFRKGRLSAALHGHLLVPCEPTLLQPSKGVFLSPTVQEEKEEIAQYVVEGMSEKVTYVLGPGTTVAAIADEMGVGKTLLGVDVVRAGRLVAADVNEDDLLRTMEGEVELYVTPIGSQGFIFGRGNQQLSPEVLRRIGKEGVRVVATPTKLRETGALRVDTGDPSLDDEMRGYLRVIVGYNRERMVRVL